MWVVYEESGEYSGYQLEILSVEDSPERAQEIVDALGAKRAERNRAERRYRAKAAKAREGFEEDARTAGLENPLVAWRNEVTMGATVHRAMKEWRAKHKPPPAVYGESTYSVEEIGPMDADTLRRLLGGQPTP